MSAKIIKILGVQHGENELFITGEGYKVNGLSRYYFDKEAPKRSHDSNWLVVPSDFKIVSTKTPGRVESYTYELKNHKLATELVPLEIQGDKSGKVILPNPKIKWEEIKTLYQSYPKKGEDKHTPIEFELEIIGKIPKDSFTTTFMFTGIGSFSRAKTINSTFIQHHPLSKLAVNKFLLPTQKCNLSATESMSIIAAHLRRHIDYRINHISYASVSQISISKKILKPDFDLEKVEIIPKDLNNNTLRTSISSGLAYPSKQVLAYQLNVKDLVGDNVFKGETHADLENNIRKYLKDLIEYLNTPIKHCTHCSGNGHVDHLKIKEFKEVNQ